MSASVVRSSGAAGGLANCASELRISESDLFRALDVAGLAMVLADAATSKISAVNEAFATMIGHTINDLIGRDLRSITHPADAVVSLEAVKAAEHGGRSFMLEKRYICSSGAVVWVELRICSITDPRSGRIHLLGVCRDITDRKNADEELRRSEWRFRSLIDNFESIVTVLNHDRTVAYHSPAVERLLGHDRNARLGRDGLELIHPDDLPMVLAYWNESISSYGAVRRFEARLRHKDGAWRWFDIIAKNMLHNPAIRGVVIVCRDASERMEIDRRLREYVTELENDKLPVAAGTAADEIRTPLLGMIGFAELLLATTLTGPQRECAERIRDSGAQLLRLLERD